VLLDLLEVAIEDGLPELSLGSSVCLAVASLEALELVGGLVSAEDDGCSNQAQ